MSSDEESIGEPIVSDVENDPMDVENVDEIGEPIVSDVENDPMDVENVDENNGEGVEVQDDDEATKVTVKPPKKVIQNPQPKLNEETLKGPRGLTALENYFERVKFKGKGYEDKDLTAIMRSYEFWCHRLFPKFPFDTCIEKLEKLGTKKATMTHIKRIRYDMIVEDKPIIDSDEENVEGFVDIQPEQLNQQSDVFDTLVAAPIKKEPPLSEEQLEKIRINKEKAAKLRQERLEKIKAKAAESITVSAQLPGASILSEVIPEAEPKENSETFNLEGNLKGKGNINGKVIKKVSKKQNFCDTVPSLHNTSDGETTKSDSDHTKSTRIRSDDDDEEIMLNGVKKSSQTCDTSHKDSIFDSDDDSNETSETTTKLNKVILQKRLPNSLDSDEDNINGELSSNKTAQSSPGEKNCDQEPESITEQDLQTENVI